MEEGHPAAGVEVSYIKDPRATASGPNAMGPRNSYGTVSIPCFKLHPLCTWLRHGVAAVSQVQPPRLVE